MAPYGFGPSALFTAAIRSVVDAWRGSYVTTASLVSSPTLTRLTPLTASSADRTALVQPSHVMPDTTSVTVAGSTGCGLAPFAGWSVRFAGELEPRQPAARAAPITINSSRLVIGTDAIIDETMLSVNGTASVTHCWTVAKVPAARLTVAPAAVDGLGSKKSSGQASDVPIHAARRRSREGRARGV